MMLGRLLDFRCCVFLKLEARRNGEGSHEVGRGHEEMVVVLKADCCQRDLIGVGNRPIIVNNEIIELIRFCILSEVLCVGKVKIRDK